MSEPFWVAPKAIRYKITPHADLSGEKGGDWDIERRHPLTDAVKHRAIWERFDEGKRWEDTDLFRVTYRRRFDDGGTVRGAATWEALALQYYERVDGLFASMRRDGFQLENNGKLSPLPALLIGRRGEVFIGNQGNHRLAIAHVLGLKDFAGKVICRHPLSPQ